MRLTIEQRVATLERETVVLHDTVKLLHKLLKEQHHLIHDYITREVSATRQTEGQQGRRRPENELYTFVCGRRFERLEKQVEKIRKSVENEKLGLKVG
jgi:hypothetical protein